MEIVINRTGRRMHLPPDFAQAFIEAGLAEQYIKPAPLPIDLPTLPEWHVAQTNNGDYQIICRQPSGVMLRYVGPVEKAADGFKQRTWSGESQAYIMAGPVPPDYILSEYKMLKGSHDRDAWRSQEALQAAKAAQLGK